jgi:hypothetical protein
LKHSRSGSEMIRLRICKFIQSFLQAMNVHSRSSSNKNSQKPEFDDHTFQKMQICLVERLRDCNQDVQMVAIRAASMLQLPRDRYCPIVNSFCNLLKHESLINVSLLVLDCIVINNETFKLIKEDLIYHSNCDFRNKVFQIVYNKIPSKFIDSKLKKSIIEGLLRNKNRELLQEFIHKWMTSNNTDNKQLDLLNLVSKLEIDNVWMPENISSLDSIFEHLNQVMNLAFEEKSMNEIIDEINEISINSLFNSIEGSFLLSSFLRYFISNKNNETIERLNLDSDELYIELNSFMRDNNTDTANKKNKFFITLNLLRSLFDLKTLQNDSFDENKLTVVYNYFEIISFNNNNIDNIDNEHNDELELEIDQNFYLYNLIIKQLDFNLIIIDLCRFVIKKYESFDNLIRPNDHLKSVISIVSAIFSNMEEKNYCELENIPIGKLLDQEEKEEEGKVDENNNTRDTSVIDYLIETIALGNISNLNPQIRRLSVRILGLAGYLNHTSAECYLTLMTKVNFNKIHQNFKKNRLLRIS